MNTSTRLQLNVPEQKDIILLNFSKMLSRRNIIKHTDIPKIHTQLSSLKPDNNIYNIKINDISISLLLYFFPLTTIKKSSAEEEFILKKKDMKFIIAKEITKKTYSQAIENNTETFELHDFLIDIPSNPLVPLHILLTNEQKNILLKLYQEKELPKIKVDDIMAKYIGAKKGDIIKIIRNTINSGESVYYRKVI